MTTPLAKSHSTKETLIDRLRRLGVLTQSEEPRVIRIPSDPSRKDGSLVSHWQVWMDDQPRCHVTIGPQLSSLHDRTKGINHACPSITARILAWDEDSDGPNLLATELYSGKNLKVALEKGHITSGQAKDCVLAILSCLESTHVYSSNEAAQMELQSIVDDAINCPLLSEAEKALIGSIRPWLSHSLTNSRGVIRKRWSNGDFIDRNIIITEDGAAKLIDYEFATETHFPEEDIWRWKILSSPASAALLDQSPINSFLEIIFLLKQLTLETCIRPNNGVLFQNITNWVGPALATALVEQDVVSGNILFPHLASTKLATLPFFRSQLFWTTNNDFSEKKSIEHTFKSGEWQDFIIPFNADINPLYLRFDPLDGKGLIEISASTVKAENNASTAPYPIKLFISGGENIISLSPHSHWLSLTADPQLFFTAIPCGMSGHFVVHIRFRCFPLSIPPFIEKDNLLSSIHQNRGQEHSFLNLIDDMLEQSIKDEYQLSLNTLIPPREFIDRIRDRIAHIQQKITSHYQDSITTLRQKLDEQKNQIDALLAQREEQGHTLAQQRQETAALLSRINKEASKYDAIQASLETSINQHLNKIDRMTSSWSWRLTIPLRALRRAFRIGALASRHRFHLDKAPLQRSAVTNPLTVEGWFFDETGAQALQIKIRIGRRTIACRQVERPDVKTCFPNAEIRTGFYKQFHIGKGLKLLQIEAETRDGKLVRLARRLVWCSKTRKQATQSLDVRRAPPPILHSLPTSTTPELTIIIPVYNKVEYTLRCLNSLLYSKPLLPYEVIIADDGSNDATESTVSAISGIRYIKNSVNLGFLRNCNNAALHAKGKYLLFLNNDTEVYPDTIANALQKIKSDCSIGVVGSKLIMPDGRLQEAGSIIWNDGSCLGYCRGAPPTDFRAQFERECDYVSGAFLLTPAHLFRKAGGFDEAYKPAYYEETQYCVWLQENGYRIIYDPTVELLHSEFSSAASVEQALEKQRVNQRIFVLKNENFLSGKFPPSRESITPARSSKSYKGKILYIDDQVPHRNMGAGFPRSNDILHALLDIGYHVTFYPHQFPNESWSSIYSDIDRRIEVAIDLGSDGLNGFLKERASFYSHIFVSRPHNYASLNQNLRDPKISALYATTQVIYDAEALFYRRRELQLRLGLPGVTADDLIKEKEFELGLLKTANKLTLVSQHEHRRIKENIPDIPVHIVGHRLECLASEAPFESRRDFLFLGTIQPWPSPNADSLIWFIHDVWPHIQKALGHDIYLIVVGENNCPKVASINDASIKFRGRTDNLSEVFNQARCFVAPTRYAAGIPHKVHHAAAKGLPTIATDLLAKQLGWSNGNEILCAGCDDPLHFSAQCVSLYTDSSLWIKLRKNALEKIRTECNAEVFREAIQNLFP